MAKRKNAAEEPNEERMDESLQLIKPTSESEPDIVVGTILEHYMSTATLETLLGQFEQRLGVARAA